MKWFASSGGLARWPRQPCIPSSRRLGCGTVLLSAFFLVEPIHNITKELFGREVSHLLSTWDTSDRAQW